MQEAEFENYMMGRLTEKVRIQRGYALKRIERAQGVDLDAEFEKDQLADLISKYSYSASDSRAGRPNPSNMDIDSDKLLTHLRWYKSHLTDYARFRGGVPLSGAAAAAIEPEDEFMEEVVYQDFCFGTRSTISTAPKPASSRSWTDHRRWRIRKKGECGVY